MSHRHWLAATAASLATCVAWAGTHFDDQPSTCTAINCKAMTIRGVNQSNEPFLIQVFAKAGECLRLDVDTQTEDTALLLLAPAVNYFGLSDDRDFDGGDFRPAIGVDPVPWTGWYTVAISYYDYDDRPAKFNLIYGRYPSGNPNCQPPPTAAGKSARPPAAQGFKSQPPAGMLPNRLQ